MSRFNKLSHVLWHCQYHIVWVPKYRYRILTGEVAKEVHNCINIYCARLGCEVVELNVQADHVHLLVKVPPKQSISGLLGAVKGRTAIRIFKQFPYLRKKPYWGNHFWAKGYCVDTVGVNAEMIRKYVKYQEKLEQQQEQLIF
jgi:REP-associated tyrosine transposase